MKIVRDGKTYELTANELSLAYEEARKQNMRDGIIWAIERNSENLVFDPEEYTRDEFIDECVDRMEEGYYSEDEDAKYDEVVCDMAESCGVWRDDE